MPVMKSYDSPFSREDTCDMVKQCQRALQAKMTPPVSKLQGGRFVRDVWELVRDGADVVEIKVAGRRLTLLHKDGRIEGDCV